MKSAEHPWKSLISLALVSLLILYQPEIHTAAHTCSKGWFGNSCKFQCKCAEDKCDFTTGECLGVECSYKGCWGPACQYADMMPFHGTPSWLYDKDDNTCNNQRTSNVSVTLYYQILVSWIRMVFKNPGDLNGIKLEFKDNLNQPISCENKGLVMDNSQTLDIFCEGSSGVKVVEVKGAEVKHLCTLRISGDRNVAAKQLTQQSSTASATTSSSNAVDGKTDGVLSEGSCTQTAPGDSKPTWTLTFPQPMKISRYVLYNRRDSLPDRLLHFKLTSYTEDNRVVFDYKDTNQNAEKVLYIIPTTGDTAGPVRKVVIEATHTRSTGMDKQTRKMIEGDPTPVLTLCEVGMYGEVICPEGYYGKECEHTCKHCPSNRCAISTGGCILACADGEGDCLKKKNEGKASTCTSTEECGQHSTCIAGVCACHKETHFFDPELSVCSPLLPMFAKCAEYRSCMPRMACLFGKCQCDPELYVYDKATDSCMEKSRELDSCSDSSTCLPDLQCLEGKCHCPFTLVYNNVTKKCETHKVPVPIFGTLADKIAVALLPILILLWCLPRFLCLCIFGRRRMRDEERKQRIQEEELKEQEENEKRKQAEREKQEQTEQENEETREQVEEEEENQEQTEQEVQLHQEKVRRKSTGQIRLETTIA